MRQRPPYIAAILLLSAAILNRFTAAFVLDEIRMEAVAPFLDIWAIGAIISSFWIILSKKAVPILLRNSVGFWLFVLIWAMALYFQGNLIFYAKFKLLRNATIIAIWLLAAYGLLRVVIPRLQSKVAQGIAAAVFGLFSLFIITEIALAWPARTHAYTRTFANNTWFMRYGGPVNELGYHDYPATPIPGDTRKTILFIGDSFLAGPGIENIDERFTGVVQTVMKDKFRIVNLGWGGYDTRDELRSLREFPYPVDRVILCWLPNDILPVADSLGYAFERQFQYTDLGVGGWIIERSFALNYLYWSVSHDDFPEFLPRLKKLYDDPQVWEAHTRDLAAVHDYCKSKNIPLGIIVLPYPQNIGATRFATEKTVSFFQNRGVAAFDVGIIWSEHPPKSLVLNVNDGHPSHLAHFILGNWFAKSLALEGDSSRAQ